MKQETLKEIAEKETEVQGWGKYESNSEQYAIKQAFINGAKWQQERSYTEEDLEVAFIEGRESSWSFNDWFIQFKKKQL